MVPFWQLNRRTRRHGMTSKKTKTKTKTIDQKTETKTKTIDQETETVRAIY